MNSLNQFEQVKSGFGVDATAAASEILNKVFLWMTVGLALTGTTAIWVADNTALLNSLTGGTVIVLFLIQLGLVFWLSARVMHMQPTTAAIVFLAYSLITGITLAPIFLVYTASSIGMTFLITAGTFGAMATYGIVTKTDLTRIGNILIMALIGIIIASVVNIFLGSGLLDFVISIIGVIVFTGLTAYDAQKIKDMSVQLQGESSDVQFKVSILGALTLYLDFINLFIMLLRLFGDRRD